MALSEEGYNVGIISRCLVPECKCGYFRSTVNECSCGHYPASHKNLGPANFVSIIADILFDENELEVLMKVSPEQENEFPKIFNRFLKPYSNGSLVEFQETFTGLYPEWTIRPTEILFTRNIGSGAFSKVYSGIYLKQPVAIKVLDETNEKGIFDEVENMIWEFRIMSMFKSPYLVHVYGVILFPRISMVIEFCDRGSLYDVIRDNDFELTLDQMVLWLEQSLEGLHALHTNDPPVIHRDIKTLNILLTSDNTVKIADFGLSVVLDEQDDPRPPVKGTYAYCAPEVYFGNPNDVWSDVYSFAIVIWELLTKFLTGVYQAPFSEYNFQFDLQIVVQVSKYGRRPTIPAKCPRQLEELITNQWSSDIGKRLNAYDLKESIHNIYKKFTGQ